MFLTKLKWINETKPLTRQRQTSLVIKTHYKVVELEITESNPCWSTIWTLGDWVEIQPSKLFTALFSYLFKSEALTLRNTDSGMIGLWNSQGVKPKVNR